MLFSQVAFSAPPPPVLDSDNPYTITTAAQWTIPAVATGIGGYLATRGADFFLELFVTRIGIINNSRKLTCSIK